MHEDIKQTAENFVDKEQYVEREIYDNKVRFYEILKEQHDKRIIEMV
jgi:hypothetical protein